MNLLESGRGQQVGNVVVFSGETMADPIQMTKHADEVFAIKGSGSNKKFTPIDIVLERVKKHDAELRAQAAQIEVVVDPDADIEERPKRELVVMQGDFSGFPKEFNWSFIARAIQTLHDERFGIKRVSWTS